MERYEFGNSDSANILVQLIGDHELSGMEKEVAHIREIAGEDTRLQAYLRCGRLIKRIFLKEWQQLLRRYGFPDLLII